MAEKATASEPITIDIWTDVVCPWCYVGEGRLQEAIRAENLEDVVQIYAHSFELDPSAPEMESAENNIAHLVKKLSRPEATVRQMEEQIQGLAGAIDLPYATDRPMANTRAIHRLVQAAAAIGRGNELFRTLQRGYFTNELSVFDKDALVAEAVKVGLTEEVAREALNESSVYEDAVAKDIARARQLGVTGVPFMVFNQKYAAPGAMEVDAYRQALRTLVAEASGAEASDAAGDGTGQNGAHGEHNE